MIISDKNFKDKTKMFPSNETEIYPLINLVFPLDKTDLIFDMLELYSQFDITNNTEMLKKKEARNL